MLGTLYQDKMSVIDISHVVRLQAAQTNLTDSTFKFNSLSFPVSICTELAGRNVLQRDTVLLLYLCEYMSEPVLYHFYSGKESANLCNPCAATRDARISHCVIKKGALTCWLLAE